MNLYINHNGTTYDETILNETDTQPEDPSLGNEPTGPEILKALTKMLYEKSPCQNGIPTEAFQNLGSADYLFLPKMILKYWHDSEYNLEAFTKLGLCILPKTGNLSNQNRWRGIALSDVAAKVNASITTTRLTKHIATFGMDEQCGLLFGKGCADATFTLQLSLQTL